MQSSGGGSRSAVLLAQRQPDSIRGEEVVATSIGVEAPQYDNVNGGCAPIDVGSSIWNIKMGEA